MSARESLVPIVLPHSRNVRPATLERRGANPTVDSTTPLVQWGFTSPGTSGVRTWEADDAIRLAYYSNVYVWACAKAIAEDVASLSFRAGSDPEDPESYDPASPLANLLGPPSLRSPGGPAPKISAKTWWEWTVVQLLITGSFFHEAVGLDSSTPSLWPIPAPKITPVDSNVPGEWFSAYRYGGWGHAGKVLTPDEVLHYWRPSQDDFRRPESVLQAARLDVSVAVMQDRYDHAFLKNDARPAAVIVHEGFAEQGGNEAFQAKFLTDHQGVDNAGKPIFVKTTEDGAKPSEALTIVPLGLSQRDGEFIARYDHKIRAIIVAFGVPMTRLGDSSERTFSNAGQEYFNYYKKLKNICRELSDAINTDLAPRIGGGRQYGWFDTQPLDEAIEESKIQAAGLTELVKTRLIKINEGRAQLGLESVPGMDRFLTDEEMGLLQGAAAQILVQQAAPPPELAPSDTPSASAPSAEPEEKAAPAAEFTTLTTETRETPEDRQERRIAAYNKRARRVALHEVQMQDAVQEVLERQLTAVVSRLQGKRGRQALRVGETREPAATATDELFDVPFWIADTVKRTRPVFDTIFNDASSTVLEELSSGDFDVHDSTAYSFIEARANQLAGHVTDTTYKDIQQALRAGMQEGEAVPVLAERIRHLFEQTYKNRAETVARTEVISAYNGSALATGMALPTDVVAGFEWLATPGNRTRASHAAADGQVVPTGARFAVGGTEMAYPGDPSAPAGLIVNCRCTLLVLTHEEYQQRTQDVNGGFTTVTRGRHTFYSDAHAMDALLSRVVRNPPPEDDWLAGRRLPFGLQLRGDSGGHPFHGNQHTGGKGGAPTEWKPSMSKEDADAYVKGQGTKLAEPFFHGTTNTKADIAENGFDLGKVGAATGNYGMMGAGVYTTSVKQYAKGYAGSGDVYETRIVAKNPMSHSDFTAMCVEKNITPFNKEKSAELVAEIKSRGHDSVLWRPETGATQTADELVVFDKKQIVVVAKESNA